MNSDTLQTIFAGLALVLALVDFIWNIFQQKQCNNLSETSLKVSQGNLEVELRVRIEEAQDRVERWIQEMNACEDEKSLAMAVDHFDAAEESLRNAYENVCSKYLQGMLDENDFESMYKVEIRQMVEDENHRKHYRQWKTAYENTMKVYNDWHP